MKDAELRQSEPVVPIPPCDKWVFIRNKEVRRVFDNRQEAVTYFKELLKQTLRYFDKQDYKSSEYTYAIFIPEMEFKPIKDREAYLSLL